MQIELINRQRAFQIEGKELIRFAESVFEELGLIRAQASVVFVSDRQMRKLNRNFRSIDKPTDVLSFSYSTGALYGADSVENGESECSEAEPFSQTVSDPDYFGDVVISTETAARYADNKKISFDRELKILIIHGILHLCGYDHETDNGEMNRLEQKLRKRLLSNSRQAAV